MWCTPGGPSFALLLWVDIVSSVHWTSKVVASVWWWCGGSFQAPPAPFPPPFSLPWPLPPPPSPSPFPWPISALLPIGLTWISATSCPTSPSPSFPLSSSLSRLSPSSHPPFYFEIQPPSTHPPFLSPQPCTPPPPLTCVCAGRSLDLSRLLSITNLPFPPPVAVPPPISLPNFSPSNRPHTGPKPPPARHPPILFPVRSLTISSFPSFL